MSFDWRGKDSLAREEVEVPAGRFAGTAVWSASVTVLWKTITADSRIHTDVPIYGIVKSSASTGRVSELVDYGETGARSALASP